MDKIYNKVDWSKYLCAKRVRTTTRPGDFRNEFESDMGRVIFSPALRRMHDKAQVIPLTSGDSIHTRLTHSLEVMSIAYSLGVALCRDERFKEAYGEDNALLYESQIPVILKTAALAHDIGNPPFGHFGETIIQKYFREYFEKKGQILPEEEKADFTEFDGNAQGFRILTRLQYLGDLAGLNLTYATLGAYTKYPNSGQRQKGKYIGLKKHGVFTTERAVLEDIEKECGLQSESTGWGIYTRRHPLSFLVEAADSICYNVMDIEDGVNKKWFSYKTVIEGLNAFLNKDKKDQEKRVDIQGIVGMKLIPKDKRTDKKKMVDFRICVISYFVKLAVKNFVDNLEGIDKGTYTKELIEDDSNKISKAFQRFAQERIYTQREIQEIELTGVSVITGLLNYLTDYVFSTDEQYRRRAKSIISRNCLKVVMHESKMKDGTIQDGEKYYFSGTEMRNFDLDKLSTRSKLRMIVDFVSGMTDKYAVNLYRQLNGQQLHTSL